MFWYKEGQLHTGEQRSIGVKEMNIIKECSLELIVLGVSGFKLRISCFFRTLVFYSLVLGE